MCHFITAVLPRSANRDVLVPILDKHGRKLDPQPNPSIEAQLRPGERYFVTTCGPCDCGTALGSLGNEEKAIEKRKHTAETEEKRLKKQGWSETKIARWRMQKQEHFARPRHSVEPTEWLDLLKEVLGSGHTSSFGVLLHWYRGALNSRIELKGRREVKLSELTTDLLGRMQEDVLYEFKTGA